VSCGGRSTVTFFVTEKQMMPASSVADMEAICIALTRFQAGIERGNWLYLQKRNEQISAETAHGGKDHERNTTIVVGDLVHYNYVGQKTETCLSQQDLERFGSSFVIVCNFHFQKELILATRHHIMC